MIPTELTADELRMVQLLRAAGKNADMTAYKRDGAVVNVKLETIHREQFEKTKLREVKT